MRARISLDEILNAENDECFEIPQLSSMVNSVMQRMGVDCGVDGASSEEEDEPEPMPNLEEQKRSISVICRIIQNQLEPNVEVLKHIRRLRGSVAKQAELSRTQTTTDTFFNKV